MDTEKERVIHDVVPENHMSLTLFARDTPHIHHQSYLLTIL